ncbi:hypothetical protein HYW73_02780 [Candidatus Nomurabacteria bacterium]|nr:hypothetical protein [Candidatus Nomurabacteria bacterium]
MGKKLLIFGFIILVTNLPFGVNAASPTSILVDVIPENPAPDENVSISLSSYASNLDSVLISWSVNGKIISSGIGKKSFSTTSPSAGKEARVVATVALPDGSIDRIITIRPAVMALLWQANDSYVPPFYKGKAMPTADSEVKVVAMPEIRSGTVTVSPKNMVYVWKKDYTNDQTASGYGKNFYTYVNDYLEDSNSVSVVASTTDQKYSSQASMNIGTYEPKILFYKNDATMGTLWEQALSNGHRVIDAEILEAAPYFISPKDLRIPSLTWSWSINDTYVAAEGIRKNLLPLRVQNGVSGASRIKLEINNKYKLFADATGMLTVEF